MGAVAEAQRQQDHMASWGRMTEETETQIKHRQEELDQVGRNLERYAEQLQTKDMMLDLAANLQKPDPRDINQGVVTLTSQFPAAPPPESRAPRLPTDTMPVPLTAPQATTTHPPTCNGATGST